MDKCINTYFLVNDEFKISKEFKNYNTSIGKSLYEVIRISDGIPIFLMEHIKRLENSAKIMKYNLNITSDEIINRIIKLISKNSVCDGNIKLVINDNFLAYFVPHNYPSKQEYAEGVKTITFHGERSNPNAKVINSVFREKVNEQINNKNAYEAILVDDAGFITEGSKSNIFLVKGSTVVTSKVINVLQGITRQFVIKTCEKLNIVFQEKNIHESDLESYNGLFISGTSPKVLPIKSVDGFCFNSSNNQIINSIMSGFDDEFNKDKQKFVKFTQSRTINK
ncbi:MAG: branched-chain amino acid aminotransferase [Clostridium sp.]|jgi:branched-chain amino acid aminotransferase